MKTEDLKKNILEKTKYIKTLTEKRDKIDKALKKLKSPCEKEKTSVKETTGKGHGVNRRASHKGEFGKTLQKEEEIEEMMGVGLGVKKRADKRTKKNPVNKEKLQESILRKLIKNQVFKAFLKEDVENYVVTVKHDKGSVKIKTSASSEDAAKKKVMSAENCPETAILSIKKA